jgi:8-oxo-dGTP pyrophosphatase MutT (NUDIX family)
VKYRNETCILFEKRSAQLKHQPGEICFPGGGIKSTDRGTGVAAVRETCEELGLESEDLELIAPLDILVTPFNAVIYPYVGYIKDFIKIIPNKDEVEEVFYVPVKYLLDYKPLYNNMAFKIDISADLPYHLIPQGRDYQFREVNYPVYFYIWQNWVIWGMTARILNHFLQLIK